MFKVFLLGWSLAGLHPITPIIVDVTSGQNFEQSMKMCEKVKSELVAMYNRKHGGFFDTTRLMVHLECVKID